MRIGRGGVRYGGLLVLCCLLGACGRPDGEPSRFHEVAIQGETMGTTYTVKVVRGLESAPLEAELRATVETALDLVDRSMSTWKADSEVSRFNRHQSTVPFAVSQPLFAVVGLANEISERSGGSFDATVSPLVDAWGFGPQGEVLEAPTQQDLEALRTSIGFEKLRAEAAQSDEGTHWLLQKSEPALSIDLSGIAKGYAVDAVAVALEDELEVDRYMVEVGGEVRTSGHNLDGVPWRIAIEVPEASGRELHSLVELAGWSLATSGDYRNYWELDGKRLSHTIDPRTGRPIAHRLASVSVVSERCAAADAWATALLVLGADGVDLAREESLAALFLFREADGSYRHEATPRFGQFALVSAGAVASH